MTNANQQADPFGGHGQDVPEQDFAGFIKPENRGEKVVGRVTALKTNQYGRYLVMERRDGARFNFPVPTHVDNNFPVHDFVGQVMGFAFTDTMDVGETSPMKVYTVRNFGDSWDDLPPEVAGVEESEDLPF